MASKIAQVIDVATMVSEDCVTDAKGMDAMPFSGLGVGRALGHILAQIKAVADCVTLLAEEIRRLEAETR